MILSPLQLEKRVFTKISVVAALGSDQKNKGKIQAHAESKQHCEDSRKWMVTLDVAFLPEAETAPISYNIDIQIVGFFAVDPKWPDEKVVSLATVNGPSLLYGAVREMVTNLTSRGPHPRVDLPTVVFFDPAKKGDSTRKGKGAKQTRVASSKRKRSSKKHSTPDKESQ